MAEDKQIKSWGSNETVRTSTWLRRALLPIALCHCPAISAATVDLPAPVGTFLETYCYNCHDNDTKKGGLDLESLTYDPNNRDSVAKWIRIHDRVEHGEMPPPRKPRPPQGELETFVGELHVRLDADDRARIARTGRAPQRRLNRDEYENAVRDLLSAPWLDLKSSLPNDGEAFGFNKSAAALDISHVQMTRYLAVAELAIREILALKLQARPLPRTIRYYARDQEGLTQHFSNGGAAVERWTFPVLGFQPQPQVRLGSAPLTVGGENPVLREQEAVGQVSRYADFFRPLWNRIDIPATGHYRIRLSGYSLTAAYGQGTISGVTFRGGFLKRGERYGKVDLDAISTGRRNEPIAIFAVNGRNRKVRPIGAECDLGPEPSVCNVGTAFLNKGEMLVIDPVRLFVSAAPVDRKAGGNPFASKEGVPAVAFRWIEVEGPLPDESSAAGYRLLFGDLPVRAVSAETTSAHVEILSNNAAADGERLMREFIKRTCGRIVNVTEMQEFLDLVARRMDAGSGFGEALIAGYAAVLTSPLFLGTQAPADQWDAQALAARLASLLWNSTPDDALLARAKAGELHKPEVLNSEVERLLADRKTSRFMLYGDLPLKEAATPPAVGRIEVITREPGQNSERLMREFMRRAYRRTAGETEVREFSDLVATRQAAGSGFAEAMIAGYTAVLASPAFLLVQEKPGRLGDEALATRLALFLWNSPPDDALRARAKAGELHDPEVLRAETERLLADRKSSRFIESFLDYWLDLRKRDDVQPSATLYNDYYLDDALADSALKETRMFFADLIERDLPSRNLVDSDFTYLNERLALHYGIPNVEGIAMRRVSIPAGSPRGGIITQAAVLKVTSNGTTTSPVIRGKWVAERIMGLEIPPPPPVPAVDPDIRGATTIREQLDKHRADASCAACHQKIDPPGFALESFDVMGGWRDRYRASREGAERLAGIGYDGKPFKFHHALPVDASGQFSDGTPFRDIRDFKKHLSRDEAALARNITRQLVTYATGAPIGYSDRAKVEQIIEASANKQYGLSTIIHQIIQSDLFQKK